MLCLVLHLTLPLLPMLIEWWKNHSISEGTATLTASMYAITIGLSSRSPLLFGLGIIMSLLFSVAYGIALSVDKGDGLDESTFASLTAIVFMLVFHALERYNRHAVDKTPFLDFSVTSEELDSEV